jgi:transcriptional regulator with XRE-family HTH domain
LVHYDLMTLSTYLAERNLSLTKFAEAIGVSVETVRRYCEGTRTPRPALMAKIKAATAGSVTADDFVPAPAPQSAAAESDAA